MTKMFSNLDKYLFVCSLLVFAFGYGFAASEWGLFPKTYVKTAWQQLYWQINEQITSHERRFDRQGARTYRPDETAPGVIAVASWWEGTDGPEVGIKLIDRTGQVLHQWLVDRGDVLDKTDQGDPTGTDVQGSLLLPDGDVIFNLEYVGTVRLNSCSEVLWTQTEGNHHSIAKADDGSFWIPGVHPESRTSSSQYPDGFSGLYAVKMDRILHVSPEGNLLDDINVIDVLHKNDLEYMLFQHGQRSGDVTHINDVEPLRTSLADEYPLFSAGDLLVSLRNIDLVFVFDPTTKKIKWYSRGPFIAQHDPDFVGNGWIGVFDNNQIRGRSDAGEGSRIVGLEPHTDSVDIWFPRQDSTQIYSNIRGKWERLDNGNLLLTEAAGGRGLEVNENGEPVWEWIHAPVNDGSEVPSVTKVSHHDLTRKEISSWPCASVEDTPPPSTQRSK